MQPIAKIWFRRNLLIIGVCIVIIVALTLYITSTGVSLMYLVPEGLQAALTPSVRARQVLSPFRYTFNAAGILNESESMEMSTSPYFWLNSGGRMYIKDGIGQTMQGAQKTGMLWQLLYARSNTQDTEAGKYPQNLFRLITRSTWKNFSEEVRFNITNANIIDTPNRDAWSGIFLMSRYKNSDNLYYAGIRMDGAAIIKKKYAGVYYTLAEKPIATTTAEYDRATNPNLIPENTWLGLKVDTATTEDGSVSITLYLDDNDDGAFEQLLSAIDMAVLGSTSPGVIDGPAFAGIRSDYFDVLFDDYTLKKHIDS